ncbi:MAG TPA: methyltransferase [Chitinophagaceae bacterium]|nr:methyltransferase [Chitinophagaceae bacterium]
MKTQQLPPPAVQIFQMITGFWASCCMYVAAKLNIPDLLAEKSKTATQLADETHTHVSSLYRLLRALCSVGIFSENDKGEFELTPLGNTLRADVPGSLKALTIMTFDDHYGAWGNLLAAVQTGEIAFDNLHKIPVWKYYEEHRENGINFNRAMSEITQTAILHILPAYDFTSLETIVDVGGGNGALLCAILKNATNTTGIVFDTIQAKQQALQNIENNNLGQRCSFEEGNFFEKIPPGASAYLMKSILHDWDDENSKKILINVGDAMPKGSKLLIIEAVIPEKNIPHPGKFMDINMLVMTGGKERTATEWKALIESAGLKFSQIVSTQSPMFSIVEAES